MQVTFETSHDHYDVKVCGKCSVKDVERLDLTFTDNCKLKDFCYVGIANNSKGMDPDILD